MKRSLLPVLSTILCAMFLGKLDFYGADTRGNKTLTVIISANNPPYAFLQYGNIVGFDIDLARVICDRLGKKFQFKNVPQNRVLSAIKSKQGDMAIAEINMTDSNEFGVDFFVPYQTNTKAFVMVNSGEFTNVPQGAYFPCWLLQDHTIGVVSGSQIENDLHELGIKNLTVRRYENINKLSAEIVKQIRHKGILYGAIVGVEDAQSMVKQNQQLIFYRLKLKNSLVVAFPRESPLRSEVNAIINELIGEGKIYALESKWEICDE